MGISIYIYIYIYRYIDIFISWGIFVYTRVTGTSLLYLFPVRRMVVPTSPFSPRMNTSAADQSSEDEEVSVEPSPKREEKDKKETKKRLSPKHTDRSDESHRDRGRDRDRARRRSRRSSSHEHGKDEKKHREKTKRERRRTKDATERGQERPVSPPGKPAGPPQGETTQKGQVPATKGKGKNKKSQAEKQICKICKSYVCGNASALDQHQWLSAYCLACQAWEKFTPYQKKQPESWNKAKKIGKEVKAQRDQSEWASAGRPEAPARSAVPERGLSVASSWRAPVELVPSQDCPDVAPELNRAGKKSRKEKVRRREASSSSSSAARRKSRRHNVTINFR